MGSVTMEHQGIRTKDILVREHGGPERVVFISKPSQGNEGERVYYMAVKTGAGTIGVVALVHRRGRLISYKSMSEDMGPFYYGAPLQLLGLLDPTPNACAVLWRSRCAARK